MELGNGLELDWSLIQVPKYLQKRIPARLMK